MIRWDRRRGHGLVTDHGNDAVTTCALTAWLPSRPGVGRAAREAEFWIAGPLPGGQGGKVSPDKWVQVTEIVFAGGHVFIGLPQGDNGFVG